MMLISFPIAVLIIGALFTLALRRDWIGISSITAAFASLVYVLLSDTQMVHSFGGWEPPFGIVWVLDSFSVFMALLVTGITALIVVYSLRYITQRKHRYYALLCLLTAGTIGVSLTGDIFNMYVFFEIMSIASYGLVAFFDDEYALEGAFKYLITGSFASSFVLIGVTMIYGLTGTLNMADIASRMIGMSYIPVEYMLVLGMVVGGFALKTAIFPFHMWKPDAIEGTPAPVGALFTSVSSAIGIYLIMRILFIFGLIQLNWILIGAGIISMFVGALLALTQKNIKRILAYSSISQVGYIVTVFGLGTTAGVVAGAYHILNNAIIEVLVFMSFGVALHSIHKECIGEVSVKNNYLLVSSLVGILALVGVPITNGFVSKWLMYMSSWQISPVITILMLAVTGFTLAYSLKLFNAVFLSPEKKRIGIPLSMKVPIGILLVLIIAIGLFPEAGMMISEHASRTLFDLPAYIQLVMG